MNAERCLLAGEALGIGYAALKRATAYAKDRIVFGRPIGTNQGIQHPLASAFMHLEAAKLATYHAARLYDDSRKDDTITRHAVGVACNSAKYLAAEAAFTACEQAVGDLINLSNSFAGESMLDADFGRSLHTVGWGMHRSTTLRGTCGRSSCHGLHQSVGYAI